MILKRKLYEKQKGTQKGDGFYMVDRMNDPGTLICLGQCGVQACVNTTEYWCVEGVKMYYSYEPCYHRGLECVAEALGRKILSWL